MQPMLGAPRGPGQGQLETTGYGRGMEAPPRGHFVAVELTHDEFQEFVDEVQTAAYVEDADLRVVLGAACTTAARTVEHLCGVLQLPYAASRGWHDMLEAIGDRAASLRQFVVILDATDLLKHEEQDLWHELIGHLHGGPSCMGGGWNTLVLADDPCRWEMTPFRTAAGAEQAHARRR
ncbi:hypothetical protein GCM10027610_129530 [Dactylosporangium cerinum]